MKQPGRQLLESLTGRTSIFFFFSEVFSKFGALIGAVLCHCDIINLMFIFFLSIVTASYHKT